MLLGLDMMQGQIQEFGMVEAEFMASASLYWVSRGLLQ